MPLIAICPRCMSHVGLPSEAETDAQLECPVCEVEFSVDSVAPRELPQARLVARPSATPVSAVPTLDQPAASLPPAAPLEANLSRLLRATAQWQPAPPATEPADAVRDRFETPELSDSDSIDPSSADATDDPPSAEDDSFEPGASRLDQLLSELLNRPLAMQTAQEYEASGVYVEGSLPAPPGTLAAASEHDPPSNRDGDRALGPATFEPETHQPLEGAGQSAGRSRAAFVGHRVDDDPARLQGGAPPLVANQDDGDSAATDQDVPRPRRRRRGLIAVVGGCAALAAAGVAVQWFGGAALEFWAKSRGQRQPLAAPGDRASPGANAPPPPALAGPPGAARDAARQLATAYASGGSSAGDWAAQYAAAAEADGEPSAGEVARSRTPRYDSAVSPATAIEPARQAAAAPLTGAASWPATPIVGDLRGAKLYTLDELKAVATGAEAALQRFLAGDLARVESRGEMGRAFIDLCALAERFTLTDPQSYGNELITEQLVAKDVFRGLAGVPARRADLGVVAARWLQHEGRQNQGIVLIGRVRDMRPQGRWTEYVLEVGSGEASLECLALVDRIRFPIGAEIALAGAIVAQPQERIAGYEGDAPQAVVAGFAFPPKDFAGPSIIRGALPIDR